MSQMKPKPKPRNKRFLNPDFQAGFMYAIVNTLKLDIGKEVCLDVARQEGYSKALRDVEKIIHNPKQPNRRLAELEGFIERELKKEKGGERGT